MQVHIKRLGREPIVEHDFAADEGFERKSSEHVEAETEACNVDHGVVGGEVIEDVALGEGAEGEEAGEGHKEASEHGDGGAVMRHTGEAIDCGGFERAVDEEGVMVANKCLRALVRTAAGRQEAYQMR